MKYKLILNLCLISMLLCSCGKEGLSLQENDSLIITEAGGWCGYNCHTAYKITNSGAFPSIIGAAGPYELVFSDTAVDNNFYQSLKTIRDNFPKYLLEHPDQNFGCAGCADGPYLFLQLHQSGTTTYWSLDLLDDEMPAAVLNFRNSSYDIIKD